MKYILLTILILVIGNKAYNQTTPSEMLSNTIAQKMKDSLQLTQNQFDQLYAINMNLQNQKALVRQQFTGNDSLQFKMQLVENMRDSLYQPILSVNQHSLYLQKKKTLVSKN